MRTYRRLMSTSPVPHRRAEPMALLIWSELRDRSEHDRRLVYEALLPRLGAGESTSSQAQSIEALRRYRMIEGGDWPSARGYREFRNRQPEPRRWPSDSRIRRAFGGSWPEAVAAAAGVPVEQLDVRTRRLTSNGKSLSKEVLFELVREWEKEKNEDWPPLEGRFIEWCRDLADAGDPRRPPRTREAIRRLFEDWNEMLLESGIVRLPSPQTDDIDFTTAPYTLINLYTHDQICAWMCWIAAGRPDGGLFMSDVDYDQRCEPVREAIKRQRLGLRVPWGSAFKKRFGTFAMGRVAAGLTTVDEQEAAGPERYGGYRRFPIGTLVDLVVGASEHLGRLPTEDEMATFLADRDDPGDPTIEELRRGLVGRHGKWPKAITSVLERRPRLAARFRGEFG